ncbi:hypothetical protein OI18_23390 [Flavihumibacter solisilvae]|uniref:Uncharacterized protein n=1 Tax=Flavihumibacter solisilvae TaxID=1349421 RepID=A0A0C1IIE7_9BACT|nr:hypothetical protein OI18_23390 [Flavihumibacter solisilvae]
MKHIKIITLIFLIILSSIFGALVFDHMQMNFENGRYFDPESATVFHEQSIIGYSILLFICLLCVTILSINVFRGKLHLHKK